MVSEDRILWISNNLELSIGVEEEDETQRVINKANDRNRKGEFLHIGEIIKILLILYGSEEVGQEIEGEVDTDEDVDHNNLIAKFMLHDVQNQEKEDAEDSLTDEIAWCYEVYHDDYQLKYHKDANNEDIELGFLCGWRYCLAETHWELIIMKEHSLAPFYLSPTIYALKLSNFVIIEHSMIYFFIFLQCRGNPHYRYSDA